MYQHIPKETRNENVIIYYKDEGKQTIHQIYDC